MASKNGRWRLRTRGWWWCSCYWWAASATTLLVAFGSVEALAQQTGQQTGQQPKQEPMQRGRGPLYHPDGPGDGAWRVSLGGLWDAIDPSAVDGYKLAIPQLLTDARYQVGSGISILGHLNTVIVSNQLEVGAAWQVPTHGRVTVMASVTGGAFFGRLGQFGFDAWMAAPIVKPGITLGYPLGDVMLSLRLDAMFSLFQYVSVGDTSLTIDEFNHFTAGSLSFTVENMLQRGGVWFYGGALMASRAYYQAWVLFSDDPSLYFYPRIFGGYEF
jgi:hypothetical protein